MLCFLNFGILRVAKEVLGNVGVTVQICSLCAVRPSALNSVEWKICFDSYPSQRKWLPTKRYVGSGSLFSFGSFNPFLERGNSAGWLPWFIHVVSSPESMAL